MSASSKKKLRREQEAAKLTEKQLTAQREAKKTRLYTVAFVAVMAVLLVVAIVVGVNQTITANGIREKNRYRPEFSIIISTIRFWSGRMT